VSGVQSAATRRGAATAATDELCLDEPLKCRFRAPGSRLTVRWLGSARQLYRISLGAQRAGGGRWLAGRRASSTPAHATAWMPAPGQRRSRCPWLLSGKPRSRTPHAHRRARHRGGVLFYSGHLPFALRASVAVPRRSCGTAVTFLDHATESDSDAYGARPRARRAGLPRASASTRPLPSDRSAERERATDQANVSSKVGAGPDTDEIAAAPGSSTSASSGFEPPLPFPSPRCCWLTSA
jgi:hypothetical protein